jgi:hypothetical protein
MARGPYLSSETILSKVSALIMCRNLAREL